MQSFFSRGQKVNNLGIVFSLIFLALIVAVLLYRRGHRHMARIEAFAERAIEKFLETENPVALLYIRIAYSTCYGTEVDRVLRPLERASEQAKMQDNQLGLARIGKVRQALGSTQRTLKVQLALKNELTDEQFAAWRKLDPSILDRL